MSAMALERDALPVLLPFWKVCDQFEAKHPTLCEYTGHGGERRREIALAQQRLQDAVGCNHRVERTGPEWQVTNVGAKQ
jgi:hypothetical protein